MESHGAAKLELTQTEASNSACVQSREWSTTQGGHLVTFYKNATSQPSNVIELNGGGRCNTLIISILSRTQNEAKEDKT